MIPMPAVKSIKNEKINSPTRLLDATFAFKTMQKFAGSRTQCSMQDMYIVKVKQLALYISGHKYMGGMDRLVRKQKETGEPEQSTLSSH